MRFCDRPDRLSCKAAPSPNHFSQFVIRRPLRSSTCTPHASARARLSSDRRPDPSLIFQELGNPERRGTAVRERGKQRPLFPSGNTTSVVRFRGHSRRPGQPWEAVTDWTPRVTRRMMTTQHAGQTASSSQETADISRPPTHFGIDDMKNQ